MADYVPIFAPGATCTATAAATITAGQLLELAATGPTVQPTASASAKMVGVAAHDAASGTQVAYFTGGVQLLVASGTVTAGQTVEAAAAGVVVTHTNGTNDVNIVGLALTTATGPATVQVALAR